MKSITLAIMFCTLIAASSCKQEVTSPTAPLPTPVPTGPKDPNEVTALKNKKVLLGNQLTSCEETNLKLEASNRYLAADTPLYITHEIPCNLPFKSVFVGFVMSSYANTFTVPSEGGVYSVPKRYPLTMHVESIR